MRGLGSSLRSGALRSRNNDPENDLFLVINHKSDGDWSIALASYQLAKNFVAYFVDPLDSDYHGSDEIITIFSDYEFLD